MAMYRKTVRPVKAVKTGAVVRKPSLMVDEMVGKTPAMKKKTTKRMSAIRKGMMY